jgi:hypothetical protein
MLAHSVANAWEFSRAFKSSTFEAASQIQLHLMMRQQSGCREWEEIRGRYERE